MRWASTSNSPVASAVNLIDPVVPGSIFLRGARTRERGARPGVGLQRHRQVIALITEILGYAADRLALGEPEAEGVARSSPPFDPEPPLRTMNSTTAMATAPSAKTAVSFRKIAWSERSPPGRGRSEGLLPRSRWRSGGPRRRRRRETSVRNCRSEAARDREPPHEGRGERGRKIAIGLGQVASGSESLHAAAAKAGERRNRGVGAAKAVATAAPKVIAMRHRPPAALAEDPGEPVGMTRRQQTLEKSPAPRRPQSSVAADRNGQSENRPASAGTVRPRGKASTNDNRARRRSGAPQ